jgi:ubiquinone/menaquinone biosynthesis C-methylase UbiE
MSHLSKIICKSLMKSFPAFPKPDDPHLWEVFKTDRYLEGSAEVRRDMRYSSSLGNFYLEHDISTSWLANYFSTRIKPDELKGKVLLDLGCFTGGRLCSWFETYQLQKGIGIDINPLFKQAGEEFKNSRGLENIEFFTGVGEALPFTDNSIDFIVSTDVFEHVQDLQQVLSECYRVLKKGGKLLVVFPQFYQPLEAHLGMVTTVPALHWIFGGETIAAAYVEIVNERGEAAKWYAPEAFPLRSWEKLFGLNGVSVRAFRKLVSQQVWLESDSLVRPILTDGRKAKKPIYRILSSIFAPLAHLPYLDEFFLGRVNYVLTK